MKTHVFIILSCFFISHLCAAPNTTDGNNDGYPDHWVEKTNGSISKISLDRNYDTKIDHIIEYDEEGLKIYEESDFNFDGIMDDFYFFEQGRLKRQEIDSNFDSRIDIWIFLESGMYIRKYEMDTDFDGKVDISKDFSG